MPQSTRMRSHGKRKKRRQQVAPMPPKMPIQPVQSQKTRRRWPWLILLVVAIVLVSIGIWHITSSPSSARSVTTTVSSTSLPTATPTSGRVWHTFLTISGNTAAKNTQKFKVPADWQLTWSCRGVDGVDGGLYIVIYNANGSLYNAGAQVTCLAAKQVIGSVEEQKSGDIYLNINGNDPWTVTVQKP
jgi:hypothetical protein